MAQLKKQTFELKGGLDKIKLIDLERIDNKTMLLKFSGYHIINGIDKEKEIVMTLEEYRQFVKILKDSKFIYSNENIL